MSNDAVLPVLFLDIDDVLCLNITYGGFDAVEVIRGRHLDPDAVCRQLFDPGAIEALRQVHDALGGRLRYVISSTWRQSFEHDELRWLLREGGLRFVATSMHTTDRWCTPVMPGRDQRRGEIAAWLDRHHQGEPFAIVDDDFSGTSLQPALDLDGHPFHGRVVLCKERVGLQQEHVQALADALSRPAPALRGGRVGR